MIFLQAVPDSSYMAWQLRVQMLNFKKMGIEKDAIVLVGIRGKASPEMLAFAESTEATVVFIEDTRVNPRYTSGIRPHIIHKYLSNQAAPNFKPEVLKCFMYHDQDIIWLEQPNLKALEVDDGISYVAAGAASYLNVGYLNAFKKYQFPAMCEIANIDPELIKANDQYTGGAQYIIKNTTPNFWAWADAKCEQLYSYLADITTMGLKQWMPEEDLPKHHVQIWTADMWIIYWGMLMNGQVRTAAEIDFYWPYNKNEGKHPIMHNAGIDSGNESKNYYNIQDATGKVIASDIPHDRTKEYINDHNPGFTQTLSKSDRLYFNKMNYWTGNTPFGEDHSFVSPDLAQYPYIQLINELSEGGKVPVEKKKKVLGIFSTHNKINPGLLNLTLNHVRIAKAAARLAAVDIVTVSWQPIPNNPFKGHLTGFRDLGHVNYILQVKQALLMNPGYDMVCILEHDMIYPPNYFDVVVKYWDYNKYGLCFNNYIGVNETGFCAVKERHHPFSLMSFAYFYALQLMNEKLDACIKQMDQSGGYGYTCVEPDDKSIMAQVDFTNLWPAMHVNMNHLSDYGNKDKNHHFTSHCAVCYEANSNGEIDRQQDWGNYRQYFWFDQQETRVVNMQPENEGIRINDRLLAD